MKAIVDERMASELPPAGVRMPIPPPLLAVLPDTVVFSSVIADPDLYRNTPPPSFPPVAWLPLIVER